VYDAALISVGDKCDTSQGDNAGLATAKNLPTTSTVVGDPSTRYADGPSSPYCTGDIAYGNKNSGYDHQVATKYTIRSPGPNSWDPLSFPVLNGCSGTGVYPGYAGDLSKALDKNNSEYDKKPTQNSALTTRATQTGYVASVFRRWSRICSIPLARAST
jgi:hypothetical protein